MQEARECPSKHTEMATRRDKDTLGVVKSVSEGSSGTGAAAGVREGGEMDACGDELDAFVDVAVKTGEKSDEVNVDTGTALVVSALLLALEKMMATAAADAAFAAASISTALVAGARGKGATIALFS